MNEHSGLTTSSWMPSAFIPVFPPLAEDTRADACIVGAGIAGLTTGYLLAREGKSVVILDDGPIAGGETERTTAHLSNALDDGYVFLEQVHGPDGARLAAESHTAAIALIESIVIEEQIPCDFTRLDGYLFAPPGVSPAELRQEFEAARRAGLAFVEALPRAPLDFFDTGPCLRFPRQAQFHPLRYLAGLVAAIQRLGGRIYANTHATRIQGGAPATVITGGGFRVECGAAVVATNSPVNDRVTIHTKQAPYRTYVVAFRVPTGAVPRALYWDTVQDAAAARQQTAPYHYVRLQPLTAPGPTESPAEELLLVGGEDHKTGQSDDAEARWDRLERWTRERFPMAGQVEYRWSGQVMEPVDGLAFIGRNPGDAPNVYIATGDSGHGMTHGTIAGMLLLDLIASRHNAWAALYDPARVRTGAVAEFAGENLNVAAKYAEYLTGGEIESPAQLAPDSGAIIRRGLLKAAVYRDEQGALHEFSAVCPHLGCIVHWNHTEKSWDCPCHGSRFSKFGEVLNGPSITNLHALSQEEAIR